MVYFIQSLDTIKIGCTKNLNERIKGIQTSNPHGLVVIGAIKGNSFEEKAIHKKLEKYRVTGEWFKNCNEVRSCIEKILNGEFRFYYDKIIWKKDGSGRCNLGKEEVRLEGSEIINMWTEYNSNKNGTLHKITRNLKKVQREINMLLAKKLKLEKDYIKTVKEK